MKRKLRLGMIGGGQGAFIGAVHRLADVLMINMNLLPVAYLQHLQKLKSLQKKSV